MSDDEPVTASLVTVTLKTGWGFFNLFDAAIQQKKAMDRERERMTLAAMASTSKPGAAGYFLFGFFTLFSLVMVLPILVSVSLPLPDNLGLIGVPLALAYAGSAVHGAVFELRRAGYI